MSPEHIVILVLTGLLVFQECYHAFQFHKVVNKLMSRSFYDYKISQTVSKIETGQPQKQGSMSLPPDEQSELGGVMQSFFGG